MESRFSRLEFVDKNNTLEQSKAKEDYSYKESTEKNHIKKAEEYEMFGDHEKALQTYAAALNENPLALDAWVGQIIALLRFQEYTEAEVWVNKAMEKFPQNPRLLSLKSIAYFRIGRQSEALMLNDSAMKNKGEFALVWLARGEIMMRFNPAISEQCFHHAIKLPSKTPGKVNLWVGEVYFLLKKYSLALSYFKKTIAESEKCAWGWYLTGKAYLELGQFDQAKKHFYQALVLYPSKALYQQAPGTIPSGFLGALQILLRRFTNG
ncbi:MAG: tetratricopeptide repeat protein [bacterium]